MKAVLVILALLGVLAFTVTVILGALAGLFMVALEDAENVNKDPENVNKIFCLQVCLQVCLHDKRLQTNYLGGCKQCKQQN